MLATPRWVGWTLLALCAVVVCGGMAYWQLIRAESATGTLLNAGYAAVFFISASIRRPLVGYLVGQLDGEGTAWREDPARLRAFTRASFLWSGLFGLRLAVQLPLYITGAVVALGVARTAMGIPLFALGLYLTYRLVQRHRPAAAAAQAPSIE